MDETTQPTISAQGGAESVIRVGQVWADNDPRNEGRTIRVDRIEDHLHGHGGLTGRVAHAVCTVLTPATEYPTARTGHQVTIRVSRMRPTSNGYRLIPEDGGA
jgi:hypothetical protein